MIETTSPSYNMGKGKFRAMRWLLVLVLTLWCALAIVWSVLHFFIVPRIPDWRPMLERYASQAVGANVRIGTIRVVSNGLIAAFELRDVTLHDAQNKEALRLPRVIVGLSARSVFTMRLEQLYIDRPELEVRRSTDGQIWIAGFAVPHVNQTQSPIVDWLLSQTELVIYHGTLHWKDESRPVDALTLSAVDFVLRHRFWSHTLQLGATPPSEWGQRLHVTGQFRQPLFTSSHWGNWVGQIYASAQHIDLEKLRNYIDLGVRIDTGHGRLRTWVDVERAKVTNATADIALVDVRMQIVKGLQPLSMQRISGRLNTRVLDGGFEFSTETLEFDTQDGLHWPGGNLRVRWFTDDARNTNRNTIVADRLDLAALAQIAQRLPLEDNLRATVRRLAPKGMVETLKGSWHGSLRQPTAFLFNGRVTQVQAQPINYNGLLIPGMQGVSVDFEASPQGGQATITMRDGSLHTHHLFDEPHLPFEQLEGMLRWKMQKQRITSIQVPTLRFSNSDMQGQLQGQWEMSERANTPPPSSTSQVALGVLELQGTLNQAKANRVHRYLPQVLDKSVREYLRNAVLSGNAYNVKFKVKGPLQDFPFNKKPQQGEFFVSADMRDVNLAFAPNSILPQNSLPWPTLARLSGELLIDHSALHVKNARSDLLRTPHLQVNKVDATIEHLYDNALLKVTADIKGPLPDMLSVVNTSPLGGWIGNALAQSSASGVANYHFQFALPLNALEKTRVRGSVVLSNNALQISPTTPRLSELHGLVSFTETGFAVTQARAQALGSQVQIKGGLNLQPGASPSVLKIEGSATAQGLRQASELGLVTQLARYASGKTNYQASLELGKDGVMLEITSNLLGMALQLPAPLYKSAETAIPLRIATQDIPRTFVGAAQDAQGKEALFVQDQLQMDWGKVARLIYIRDVSGATPKVLRGAISVGPDAQRFTPIPASSGVVANIQLHRIDWDAWGQVFSAAPNVSPGQLSARSNASAHSDYLPTSVAMQTREFIVGGRTFNHLVIGGTREGALWRANLDASEFSGYMEYRQPEGSTLGRLYARLARLSITKTVAQEVENLLDQQPASIPALDVVIDDLELSGKKLGRLEMSAVNLGGPSTRNGRPREWRLNRFNIITPEAVLTASGNWTDINVQAPSTGKPKMRAQRRTVLNFKLDINDAGVLLERFAMPGVIRNGRGKIGGQVQWLGSPITLDYTSLGGNLNVNVESGQFLKTEPGIAKLLGVLSLQSLPRRLILDFRDVFSEGFSFDFLRGDVSIEQGIARTNNLQMKGVNAAVLMEGQANIAQETQAIKVVVVPEINAGSASLIASTINPLVGLTTFLAQLIVRRPLIESATQEFFIDGTWLDPRVTKINRDTTPTPPTAPAPTPP